VKQWNRFILCLPIFWLQIFSTFVVCFFFCMVGTPSLTWKISFKTSNMESTALSPFQNISNCSFGALFHLGCIFFLSYSICGFLQDRQCTYHVTLREFVLPFLQWKSNKYYILLVCVCSLRYLAWNACAPHCPLCPVQLCSIFPRYLIRGTIFVKRLLNIKSDLIFSANFVWNISHCKKAWARYDHKCILVYM
jgi:hypothetical protein